MKSLRTLWITLGRETQLPVSSAGYAKFYRTEGVDNVLAGLAAAHRQPGVPATRQRRRFAFMSGGPIMRVRATL